MQVSHIGNNNPDILYKLEPSELFIQRKILGRLDIQNAYYAFSRAYSHLLVILPYCVFVSREGFGESAHLC